MKVDHDSNPLSLHPSSCLYVLRQCDYSYWYKVNIKDRITSEMQVHIVALVIFQWQNYTYSDLHRWINEIKKVDKCRKHADFTIFTDLSTYCVPTQEK